VKREQCARRITKNKKSGKGPCYTHNLVAEYFNKERELGCVQSDLDTAAAASLLVGACFERSLTTALSGEDPTGLTNNEFPAAIAAVLAKGSIECVPTATISVTS
jgi:hypothetical protein